MQIGRTGAVLLVCSLVAALVMPASSSVSACGAGPSAAVSCGGVFACVDAAEGSKGRARARSTVMMFGMHASDGVLRMRGGSDNVDYYEVCFSS